MLNADGQPDCNPQVIRTQPPGTILPMGGKEGGHKGAAISLLVDIMAGCLSGGGRAESLPRWGASFSVTVYSLALICGSDNWQAHFGALIDQCRHATPIRPETAIRLPGDRTRQAWLHSQYNGLSLQPEIRQFLGLH